MRNLALSIVLSGLGLSLSTLPLVAQVQKNPKAPTRAYIRVNAGANCDVYVDGFAAIGNTNATYQAVGINWDHATTAGKLVIGNSPWCQSRAGLGSRLGGGLGYGSWNTTVAKAMGSVSKLGAGARGFVLPFPAGKKAGTPVAFAFGFQFATQVTRAQIEQMCTTLVIAVDECTSSGVLKNTHYQKVMGYKVYDPHTKASGTIPAGYEQIEGRDTSFYFGLRASSRQQTYYPSTATQWTSGKTIRELWMRWDERASRSRSGSMTVQVLLSSKKINSSLSSTTFAGNHGSDVTVFMKKKKINYPSFGGARFSPRSFTFQLKGDAPFVTAGPEIMIDQATYPDATPGDRPYLWVDAAWPGVGKIGNPGAALPYGTSCNPKNFDNFATGLNVFETLQTYCYTRNKGDFVLSWLGTSTLILPIPGLSGCTLYTQLTILHPTVVRTSTATSAARFTWVQVPPKFMGLSFRTQNAAITSGLKLRISRGLKVKLGSQRYLRRWSVLYRFNYGSGSTKFDPDKNQNAKYGPNASYAPIYLVK